MTEAAFSRLRLFLRLAAGVGLVVCAASLVHLDKLSEALGHASFSGLALAFGVFTLATVPAAVVWKIYLNHLAISLSFWHSQRLSVIGFFWNNVIPSGTCGDLYRILALLSRGNDTAKAAASVFLERWSAFLALITAGLLAYWQAGSIFAKISVSRWLEGSWPWLSCLRFDIIMIGVLSLMAVAFLVISVVMIMAGRGQGRYTWLNRLAFGLPVQEFAVYAASFWHNGRLFLMTSFINLLAPSIEVVAIWLLFTDVLGTSLPLLQFFVFIPVFRVILHLPISVNGIGTQEAAFLVYWVPLGVSPDQALACSILTHAVKLALAALGGVLCLTSGNDGVSWGRLRRAEAGLGNN